MRYCVQSRSTLVRNLQLSPLPPLKVASFERHGFNGTRADVLLTRSPFQVGTLLIQWTGEQECQLFCIFRCMYRCSFLWNEIMNSPYLIQIFVLRLSVQFYQIFVSWINMCALLVISIDFRTILNNVTYISFGISGEFRELLEGFKCPRFRGTFITFQGVPEGFRGITGAWGRFWKGFVGSQKHYMRSDGASRGLRRHLRKIQGIFSELHSCNSGFCGCFRESQMRYREFEGVSGCLREPFRNIQRISETLHEASGAFSGDSEGLGRAL